MNSKELRLNNSRNSRKKPQGKAARKCADKTIEEEGENSEKDVWGYGYGHTSKYTRCVNAISP